MIDPEILELANSIADMPAKDFLRMKRNVAALNAGTTNVTVDVTKEMMSRAFGTRGAPKRKAGRPKKTKTADAVAKPKRTKRAASKRALRIPKVKTPSGVELANAEKVKAAIHSFGAASADLQVSTGLSRIDVARAVKTLEAAGTVRREGEKRATRYFLVSETKAAAPEEVPRVQPELYNDPHHDIDDPETTLGGESDS